MTTLYPDIPPPEYGPPPPYNPDFAPSAATTAGKRAPPPAYSGPSSPTVTPSSPPQPSTSTAAPPVMSAVYLNKVLDIVSDSKDLKSTAAGVAKQTGYAALGTACGGLLAGPAGALVGGVLGACVGFQQADDYQSVLSVVRAMTDDEKASCANKVQQLVGAATIEEFIRWFQTEGHRQLLLTILSEFSRQKQTTQ